MISGLFVLEDNRVATVSGVDVTSRLVVKSSDVYQTINWPLANRDISPYCGQIYQCINWPLANRVISRLLWSDNISMKKLAVLGIESSPYLLLSTNAGLHGCPMNF